MANTKISALTSATTPLAGTETLPVVQSSATTKVTVANLTAGRAVATGALTTTGTATVSGSLGVGMLSPSGKLMVNVGTDQNLNVTSTSSVLQLQGINDAASVFVPFDIAGSYVKFSPGSTEAGRFDTSGNLLVGTTTSPTGSNSIVTTNNVVFNTAAKGANFKANTPAAGMTSQLLNWYEEGSWTPAGNGVTLTSVTAYYVRIGAQVTVSLNATWPTTTNTNAANVSGLPFTVVRGGGAAIGYMNASLELHYNAGVGGTALNVYLNNGTSPTNAQLSTFRINLTCTYLMI